MKAWAASLLRLLVITAVGICGQPGDLLREVEYEEVDGATGKSLLMDVPAEHQQTLYATDTIAI